MDDRGALEPLPATVEAVQELDVVVDHEALLRELRALGVQVRRLVPDCVGMSLAYLSHGVTLTLVASDAELALLDALQYVAGGPCVEGVVAERVLSFTHDELLDEGGWQLFAHATAARGIRGTLTLPVVVEGSVVGSVNLYAASARAFDGLHREVAGVFGAWAPGAVSNADLSFRSRSEAQQAPQRLHDQQTVETAVGILAARQRMSTTEAEERLRTAAAQAGVGVVELARTVVDAARRQDSE